MLNYRRTWLVHNRLVRSCDVLSSDLSWCSLWCLSRSGNWTLLRRGSRTCNTLFPLAQCEWSSFCVTELYCLSYLLSETDWARFWPRTLWTSSTAHLNFSWNSFLITSSHCLWSSVILCFHHWVCITCSSLHSSLLIGWKGFLIEEIDYLEKRLNILKSFSSHLFQYWVPHRKYFDTFSSCHYNSNSEIIAFEFEEVVFLDH